MNVGVQSRPGTQHDVGVDYVRRVFVNTLLLGEIDYNRFNRFINGVQTPVIPQCTSAAQRNDRTRNARTAPSRFWTPGGREVYNGLLAKLDKRLSSATCSRLRTRSPTGRHQRDHEPDNYFESYVRSARVTSLNVSALADLPWDIPDRRHLGDVEPRAGHAQHLQR